MEPVVQHKRKEIIKVLAYARQKSHLGMWNIKRFAFQFCRTISGHFWAGVVHVDDSDETCVQKGHNSVHLLKHVV